MNTNDIQFLYDYSYWATRLILATAAKLSDEQFTAPMPFGHGSVKGTLVHILSAEWIWRLRCQENRSPSALLREADLISPEALQARWREEETRMRAFLSGLTDKQLGSVVSYKRTDGEAKENVLWHLLVHVVNHGTDHRSIVAAALTGHGHSPGDLDIVRFLRWL